MIHGFIKTNGSNVELMKGKYPIYTSSICQNISKVNKHIIGNKINNVYKSLKNINLVIEASIYLDVSQKCCKAPST